MKIIEQSFEIYPFDPKQIMIDIESAARTCYKSEDKITTDSAIKFVKGLLIRKHEAVIEHVSIAVKFICDRGVSHEIVRHRLASYCQESTRYCNYSNDKFGNELTFIEPCFWTDTGNEFDVLKAQKYGLWKEEMLSIEDRYFRLLEVGASPQEARSVLPNSLKTEIIMTANLREWRHFFKLRTAKEAHPQMREVACMALDELKKQIPVIFDDINY